MYTIQLDLKPHFMFAEHHLTYMGTHPHILSCHSLFSHSILCKSAKKKAIVKINLIFRYLHQKQYSTTRCLLVTD